MLKKVSHSRQLLKFDRTHQHLLYANAVKVLGENIDTIKQKTSFIGRCYGVGITINNERSKYMIVTH
jgi:hypothetical protein